MIPRDAVQAMHKLAEAERTFAADYERLAEQYPMRRERYLGSAKRCRDYAKYYQDWADSASEDASERAA